MYLAKEEALPTIYRKQRFAYRMLAHVQIVVYDGKRLYC